MNSADSNNHIIPLKFKNKNMLYSAYMPFLKRGGLFAPTRQSYRLGDKVVLVINLLEVDECLSVTGKVVWITPSGAQGNRTTGIGVQFNESPDGEAARSRIEALLLDVLSSDRPTLTM